MSKLIIMPSNNTGSKIMGLVAEYPARFGHLVGPGGWRNTILPHFALDNGAFPAFSKGITWDHNEWRRLCERVYDAKRTPQWVAVPDVVTDRLATMRAWKNWFSEVRAYGWRAAFVLQDGMQPCDIPSNADVLFLGGSTDWKWTSLPLWGRVARETGRPLHVGRVNGYRGLMLCHEHGAASCDGTGWCRGYWRQWGYLTRYLSETGP